MTKMFLCIGSVFGLLGVVAASLSSHALRPALESRGKLDSYNVAADFMIYQGLALLVVAVLIHLFPKAHFHWVAYSFVLGSILFQGTVFLKSFVSISPFGFITPLGGFVLMAGWLLLAILSLKI